MNTSDTRNLVVHLRRKRIEVTLRGGRLCARPSKALTPDIRASIETRRSEIVALLSTEQEAGEPTVERVVPSVPRSRLLLDRLEDMPALSGAPRPHESPIRACYCGGNREFVRVRGGPMWFCPVCHPLQFEEDVVERMTAPEPSWWEARRA